VKRKLLIRPGLDAWTGIHKGPGPRWFVCLSAGRIANSRELKIDRAVQDDEKEGSEGKEKRSIEKICGCGLFARMRRSHSPRRPSQRPAPPSQPQAVYGYRYPNTIQCSKGGNSNAKGSRPPAAAAPQSRNQDKREKTRIIQRYIVTGTIVCIIQVIAHDDAA
jgi:hypothetical protein